MMGVVDVSTHSNLIDNWNNMYAIDYYYILFLQKKLCGVDIVAYEIIDYQ